MKKVAFTLVTLLTAFACKENTKTTSGSPTDTAETAKYKIPK